MDPRTESIRKAAEYVAARLDGKRPLAGIVLGSGLGKLADRIENPVVIPYSEIPGFSITMKAILWIWSHCLSGS